MLNTNNFNSIVNIKPAVANILQKSHPYSFFEKFHTNSDMAQWIFNNNPCLKRKYSSCRNYEPYMNIVVLQVLYLGNEEIICELVDKEKLENNK